MAGLVEVEIGIRFAIPSWNPSNEIDQKSKGKMKRVQMFFAQSGGGQFRMTTAASSTEVEVMRVG